MMSETIYYYKYALKILEGETLILGSFIAAATHLGRKKFDYFYRVYHKVSSFGND